MASSCAADNVIPTAVPDGLLFSALTTAQS